VFVVADPSRGVRYGELLGDKRFELAISGDAPLKPVDRYRLVGRALPRAELRARVDGTKRFIQQMKLKNMRINDVTYGCLLDACVKNDRMDLALILVDKLKQDNISLNTILSQKMTNGGVKVLQNGLM
jgi:pentatricopeptide repeat protein